MSSRHTNTLLSVENASKITCLVLDVDGVLTDGTVYYTSAGEEFKGFNIKDGLGIKLAQKAGIRVGIITGRDSTLVTRRSEELGVDPVIQGRSDKGKALLEVAEQVNIDVSEIAYMGDDLPDISAMQLAGLSLAPQDAHPEVLKICDWQSQLKGGCGAVRDACDRLLEAQGNYGELIQPYVDEVKTK